VVSLSIEPRGRFFTISTADGKVQVRYMGTNTEIPPTTNKKQP